jgi:hypothetical protein
MSWRHMLELQIVLPALPLCLLHGLLRLLICMLLLRIYLLIL